MIFFDGAKNRHELPMYSDSLHMPNVLFEEVRAYLSEVNTRVTWISHLRKVMDDSHLVRGVGDHLGACPR